MKDAIRKLLDEVSTKVVGVTFNNKDGTSRQAILKKCSEMGMKTLELVREPTNKFDRNAVRVEAVFHKGTVTKNVQIGYISNRDRQCLSCGSLCRLPAGKVVTVCPDCGSTELFREGLATVLSRAIDNGTGYKCEVLQYTGGPQQDGSTKTRGVNVKIFKV